MEDVWPTLLSSALPALSKPAKGLETLSIFEPLSDPSESFPIFCEALRAPFSSLQGL